MHRLACALIAITIPAVPIAQAQQPAPDSAFVTTDTMIPMRDGVRLHTIIVAPRDTLPLPMLMERTPYGAAALPLPGPGCLLPMRHCPPAG